MERPGEISTSTAAALIGVSYEMVRRLVRSGHIELHRRGWTTVPAAVQGYSRFLREDAARAEANAAAVRQHRANAATVGAANDRRRAALISSAEAVDLVTSISRIATAQIEKLAAPKGLPASTAAAIRQERKAAAADVEATRDLAITALQGSKA